MGVMCHHTIVVTGHESDITEAHVRATDLFSWVSPISPPATNGYATFMVPPDGSKEGWSASADGDDRRQQLKDWLRSHGYCTWVEVAFGADYHSAKVTASNDLPAGSEDEPTGYAIGG